MGDVSRVSAPCGCVVRVTTEETPLSQDEIERGCSPADPEVTGAELVELCSLHRPESSGVPWEPSVVPPAVFVAAFDLRSTMVPGFRLTDEKRAAYDSAQEVIQADAERQYAALVAAKEARLRERFAEALISGLKEQARQYPGFRCDTTSNRDMLAVAGILTVSELVDSVVKALSDG